MNAQEISLSSIKINLESKDSGLYGKFQKENEGVYYKLLSKFAKNGNIFSAKIPSKYLRLLFLKPTSSFTSKDSSCSCIVTCDSGEAFLILLERNVDPVLLCRTQGNIIWADFMNDCFLILESCGRLYSGILKNKSAPFMDILCWSSVILPLNPISCVSLDNILILTDGYSSFLHEIQIKTKASKELKRLPFCGVVTLEKKNSDVIFITFNGRKYSKSLEFIRADAGKSPISSYDTFLSVHNLNLEGVMKSMKRFADIAKKEKVDLEKLNLYIEQTSVAQQLLSKCKKQFFSVSLSVSYSGCSEAYLLNVRLRQLSSVNICGKWWQLNIKIKGCDSVCFLYSDFTELQVTSSQSVSLKVTFKFVENLALNLSKNVNIEFDLVFSEFSTQKPICTFKVHEEPLDILYFLTSIKDSVLPPLYSFPFDDKVNELFRPFTNTKITPKKDASSQEKTFIILRKKCLPVIENIFPDISKTSKGSLSVTKWLQDVVICLTCNINDDNYKISVEGPSRHLTVTVKYALEKRAYRYLSSNLADDNGTLQISKELFRKAFVTKSILDIETTENNSSVIIDRIYEHVCKLINDFCI